MDECANKNMSSNTSPSVTSPTEKQLKPESSSQIIWRRIIVLSYAFFVALIGIPIWWNTTSIHRSSLPIEEINDLNNEILSNFKIRIPVYLQIKNDFKYPDIVDAINIELNQEINRINETDPLIIDWNIDLRNINETSQPNDNDYIMELELSENEGIYISPYDRVSCFYYTLDSVASNQLPYYVMQALLDHVFRSEVDLFRSSNQDSNTISTTKTKTETETETSSTIELSKDVISLNYNPQYHLTFSLMYGEGYPIEWDIENALKDGFGPLRQELARLVNFTVDTQVQFFAIPSIDNLKDKVDEIENNEGNEDENEEKIIGEVNESTENTNEESEIENNVHNEVQIEEKTLENEEEQIIDEVNKSPETPNQESEIKDSQHDEAHIEDKTSESEDVSTTDFQNENKVEIEDKEEGIPGEIGSELEESTESIKDINENEEENLIIDEVDKSTENTKENSIKNEDASTDKIENESYEEEGHERRAQKMRKLEEGIASEIVREFDVMIEDFEGKEARVNKVTEDVETSIEESKIESKETLTKEVEEVSEETPVEFENSKEAEMAEKELEISTGEVEEESMESEDSKSPSSQIDSTSEEQTPKIIEISKSDLSTFINSVDWSLSSMYSYPTLNFILYIPPSDLSPMAIINSTTNSFLIPQWGGVKILNIPQIQNQTILTKNDLEPVLEIFASQLLKLLGIPQNPKPPTVRIDFMTRYYACKTLQRAASSLNSLVRLTISLPGIAIPKSVQNSVANSISHIDSTFKYFAKNDYNSAIKESGFALDEAEKAFFEKMMVQQNFFPQEHKMAVYVPLLGPVGIVLFSGLARIKMELKGKKGEKDKKE